MFAVVADRLRGQRVQDLMSGNVDLQETPLRVFLLEDHAIVREGLLALLEQSGIDVCGWSDVAGGAAEQIDSLAPDVAVLDVTLPDGSGIEVCREVQSLPNRVKCVMLTSSTQESALFDAIIAGANGYLLKQIGTVDLVDALHQVADGQPLIDPSLVGRVFDQLRHSLGHRGTDGLTEREVEIANLICEGMTNREIASRLFIAEKTVRNNVTALLRKLGMHRRSEIAAAAIRGDLRLNS